MANPSGDSQDDRGTNVNPSPVSSKKSNGNTIRESLVANSIGPRYSIAPSPLADKGSLLIKNNLIFT